MKTHVEVVGLINVVIGALFTTLGVLVSAGALLFAPWFNGAPPWRAGDTMAVVTTILAISALFFVIGVPSLIAGVGLRKHKTWARTLAIVVATLALASFPLGTAAGLYTLWVLSQKETVQLLGEPA